MESSTKIDTNEEPETNADQTMKIDETNSLSEVDEEERELQLN